MQYEYKVVPAPTRGKKARGVKTPADRFAHTLSETMNAQAAEGWEYLRTDTLPSEQRSGLTGRTTVFQNMLVFRRAVEVAAEVEVDVEAPRAPSVDVSAIAETHAPKLPAAPAAQTMPDKPANPVFARAPRKDMAAE